MGKEFSIEEMNNLFLSNSHRKDELIDYTHGVREKLLHAIKLGDKQVVENLENMVDQILQNDFLDILKRIPSNKLRSMKNFLLSHNTLYSFHAEKEGLIATQSHYLSEKYAIMIEHTDTIEENSKQHILCYEKLAFVTQYIV